jgi:N-acetylmuramoyl-L-alanine amidase
MNFKRLFIIVCAIFVLVIALVYGHTIGIRCEMSLLQDAFILVDAGHGGADNGTSAADGTSEDGINLAISLQLYDLLRFCGFSVEMTRAEDAAVTDDTADPVRSWKVNDMYARLRQYDRADLTVSIHQNHFSDSRYSGAQVFYANTPGSKELAGQLQTAFVSTLNPGSRRAIKKGEGIYLLDHIDCTGVLVECGFLSNPQEAEKLATKTYQQKVSAVIATELSRYLSNT